MTGFGTIGAVCFGLHPGNSTELHRLATIGRSRGCVSDRLAFEQALRIAALGAFASSFALRGSTSGRDLPDLRLAVRTLTAVGVGAAFGIQRWHCGT